MEEILSSFIEAISRYYVWLMNEPMDDYRIDETEVEEVLQAYLRDQSK